jgi:hypothetical protein
MARCTLNPMAKEQKIEGLSFHITDSRLQTILGIVSVALNLKLKLKSRAGHQHFLPNSIYHQQKENTFSMNG